jgi:hypothetical protein
MKVQDEIVTLRQVLSAKLKREHELKTLLGVGFVDDIKQDWNETVTDIKATAAYQKTAETFSAASEKLAPTLQTVNSTFKAGLGSLRSIFSFGFFFLEIFLIVYFLDSSYFKTFESTLGSTVNAVKSKMAPSRSAMDFNGDDNEPLHGASGGSMSTSSTHDEHLHFGRDNLDEKK